MVHDTMYAICIVCVSWCGVPLLPFHAYDNSSCCQCRCVCTTQNNCTIYTQSTRCHDLCNEYNIYIILLVICWWFTYFGCQVSSSISVCLVWSDWMAVEGELKYTPVRTLWYGCAIACKAIHTVTRYTHTQQYSNTRTAQTNKHELFAKN